MMKIAVPSNDGSTISAHFGRSLGFLVFTTNNGGITHKEYRPNRVTGHVNGHHEEHSHDHNHDNHHHSHSGILGALSDCSAVVAGGMGRQLLIDLTEAGKKVYVTRETDAVQAVTFLLSGQLDHNPDATCQH